MENCSLESKRCVGAYVVEDFPGLWEHIRCPFTTGGRKRKGYDVDGGLPIMGRPGALMGFLLDL